MTQLLISVTSIAEAKIALENGVDIIDLKDPSAGTLGALPVALVSSIVDYMHQTNPAIRTSATIGDVPMHPPLLLKCVGNMIETKVDYIKIGFFEAATYKPSLEVLQTLTLKGLKLIAVLFAEITYPEGLIKSIKQAGFMGVMLDTVNKNGKSLLDYHADKQLNFFAEQAIENNLTLGFAGSLKPQHVAQLKNHNPTFLGFRGGVCDNNQRTLKLNAEKIALIKTLLVK